MKKAGIIHCQQTEDLCPGTTDFKAASTGKCAFEAFGPVAIVGFVSCGGCPGKRAVARAAMLRDRGAEILFLASCIKKGTPVGMPCPHHEAMKTAIEKKVGKYPPGGLDSLIRIPRAFVKTNPNFPPHVPRLTPTIWRLRAGLVFRASGHGESLPGDKEQFEWFIFY